MKRLLVLGAAIACALAGSDSQSVAQPKGKTVAVVSEAKFGIKQRHANCLAFSPDGKTLAVAEENVHLYDVSGEAPKEIGVLNSRVGFGVKSIAFSPNGKFVAFGGADETVRVWDVAAQKEVFKAKEHKGDVRATVFSPDGKLLATGSNDKTVFLWDVGDDGKLVERAVIKAQDKLGAPVGAVVFAEKGKKLVTGSSNGTFRVYTIDKTVKQTGGFDAKKGTGDVNMTSSPDSKLWAISDHKQIHLITGAAAPVGLLEGHKENVSEVAFSPDGRLLASAGRDGTMHVWSVTTKKPVATKERPGRFTCVAWAPEGATEMTLAAGLDDGNVWVMKVGYK